MAQVTKDNASEHQVHEWIAEASDLGLRPGQWPVELTTDLGNGLPFIREWLGRDDEEVARVIYRQANGCIQLTVLND